VISGFRREVEGNCALLGCYAEITTTRCVKTQKRAILICCSISYYFMIKKLLHAVRYM